MQGHTAHCPCTSARVKHTLLSTVVHFPQEPQHTKNKVQEKNKYGSEHYTLKCLGSTSYVIMKQIAA